MLAGFCFEVKQNIKREVKSIELFILNRMNEEIIIHSFLDFKSFDSLESSDLICADMAGL